jgi:O-antigen ligase
MIFLATLPLGTIWLYRVPVVNGAVWQSGVLGLYANEIVLWGVIVLCLVRMFHRLRRTSVPFSFTPDRQFLSAVLLLFAWYGLQLFFVTDRSLALTTFTRLEAAFIICLVIAGGTWRYLRLVAAFVSGAVVSSLIGIGQFAMQRTVSSTLLGMSAHPVALAGTSVVESGSERWLRAYSTFAHPNMFGGCMAFAIVVLGIAVSERPPQTVRGRVGVAVVFAILLAGALVSWSRSALIAIGVALCWAAVWALRQRKRWAQGMIGVLLSVVALFVLSTWPLVRVRTLPQTRLEMRSVDERVSGYHDAFRIIQAHPWRGVGLGNYTVALAELHPGLPGYAYVPVHAVPLIILAEGGLIGAALLALAAILLYLWWRGCGRRHASVFMLMICVLSVLMLSDHYLWSTYVGLMMAAVSIGLTAHVTRPQSLHNSSTFEK